LDLRPRALPLLVIPAGRFNQFVAGLGVLSVEDAQAALRAGGAVLVDVGVVGRQSLGAGRKDR
jgi:hypothetical protein